MRHVGTVTSNMHIAVSPIVLLEAQEQTGEIFGSETEHLLWSHKARQSKAALGSGRQRSGRLSVRLSQDP